MRIYNCKDISYMLPNCLLVKLPHLMILLGVYENIILSHSYKVPYIFVYIDGQLKSKKKKNTPQFHYVNGDIFVVIEFKLLYIFIGLCMYLFYFFKSFTYF